MINGCRVLAVITARAGSLGLPGKNYRPFCGSPLFCWSVAAALACPEVDVVAVSSNCPHVRRLADEMMFRLEADGHRFDWIDRPSELATPMSMNEDALIHAIEEMHRRRSDEYGWVVNLQPTSPIRRNGLLSRCLRCLDGRDSLLTVSRHTPFFWQYRDGQPVANYDPSKRPMRQSLVETDFYYHDNGNIYVTNADVLKRTRCRIGSRPYLFETQAPESMQIDSELDFVVMESIAARLGGPISSDLAGSLNQAT